MTDPVLSVSTANGRYYVHPGLRDMVPSITNITGKKDKPGLKYWAAREAATYAADNLEKLGGLDRDEVIQLVKMAPFARTENSPSTIGDTVHNWIDLYIKGEVVSADEQAAAPRQARDMWRQFRGFVDRYKPLFTMSEFTVWSDQHGYAGTADWAANIGGQLVLGDTKTGKSIYPDVGMQLAALAHADYILGADGSQTDLPKFDAYAVLHLRPMFARLIPVQNIDWCFTEFLGLKEVFDFDVSHADQILGYAPKIETRISDAAA